MEKGTIESYDKNCGMGMIRRASDAQVRFYAGSVVGGDRAGLAQGDCVWFEIDNIKNLHIAVKVRKVS